MVATMVPQPNLLVDATAGSSIRPDGRAELALRGDLRRIASLRNVGSVVFLWVQTIGLVALAGASGYRLAWLAVFLLFGRSHAQFNSLMHEGAHRLLFRHRPSNDWSARWLLGYPAFAGPDGYRRVHMAHHREEFGPEEPDIALYVGYPISPASLRRKMVRDATGRTGWKLLRNQLRGLRSPKAPVRRTNRSILATQATLAVLCWVCGYWFVYLLWIGSYLTVWRVINRLRAIAEHGGMRASTDRRETTHSVRQSLPTRFFLTPFNIGFHLGHHLDSGIPWRNLPRYHRALKASGFISPELEYPCYRALWRKLGSARVSDTR